MDAELDLHETMMKIADRCVQIRDMCPPGTCELRESSGSTAVENMKVGAQSDEIQWRVSCRVQTGFHEHQKGKIVYQGL